SDPKKLSLAALNLLQDPQTIRIVSVASVWELVIKMQLGKLTITAPLQDILQAQKKKNRLRVLPIRLQHVLALESLPPVHKDPFDRLLIAQACVEGATVITKDPVFGQYPVTVLW